MSFASVFSRFCPVLTHRVSACAARPSARPLVVFCTLFVGASVFLPGVLRAQTPGSLDTSFLSSASDATIFAVNTAYVNVLTSGSTKPVQIGAERVFAGGDVETLEVLDDAGAISAQFLPGTFGGDARRVYTIVTDPYGADAVIPLFYLGGLFGKTTIDKLNRPSQNIIRVNIEGTIDSAFDPGEGADDYVTSILPLNDSDQSTMVAGLFQTFNKVNYPHLVRLLRSGAIDTAFPPLTIGDGIFAMAPQIEPALGTPNPLLPQFLIGGTFSNIGNANYTKLARIDVAGNVDATFKPLLDERVLAVATQPDGKILIGGQFATVNGQAVGHLARLNQDGSLDATFNASIGVVPDGTTAAVAVYTLNLLPDGRIYVGGNFYAADGAVRHYLARLNSDGSLDTSFDPGNNVINSVQNIAVQQDNRILVAETVSKKINNTFPPSLVRLYGDGTTSFSTVSVTAPKANAHEGTSTTRKNGVFTLTRTGGDTDTALTVYFTLSGTAQSGTAYRPLAVSSVGGNVFRTNIPAGAASVSFKVKPLNNVLPDAPETLTLTLSPALDGSPLYDLGGGDPVAATVQIANAP